MNDHEWPHKHLGRRPKEPKAMFINIFYSWQFAFFSAYSYSYVSHRGGEAVSPRRYVRPIAEVHVSHRGGDTFSSRRDFLLRPCICFFLHRLFLFHAGSRRSLSRRVFSLGIGCLQNGKYAKKAHSIEEMDCIRIVLSCLSLFLAKVLRY